MLNTCTESSKLHFLNFMYAIHLKNLEIWERALVFKNGSKSKHKCYKSTNLEKNIDAFYDRIAI